MKDPLLTFALATLAVTSLGAQSGPAPRVATTMPPAEQVVLEAIRRSVWVSWFAGDTAALRRELGPELIAISGDGWNSLEQTISLSAGYKAGGGKLVSVGFEDTKTHRFGEVVVMFSKYTIVLAQGGKQTTTKGRATEVFVKANGRWVHTSWHIDSAS